MTIVLELDRLIRTAKDHQVEMKDRTKLQSEHDKVHRYFQSFDVL
jgi:hypothetical protein